MHLCVSGDFSGHDGISVNLQMTLTVEVKVRVPTR